MKKILFILFFVLLSLSLILPCSAIGNRYIFSDSWNSVVFSKSIVLTDTDQSGSLISAGILTLDYGTDFENNKEFEIGFEDSLDFKGVQYTGSSAKSSFDVTVPVNLSMTNEQTLSQDFYFLSSQQLTSFSVSLNTVGSSTLSIPLSITEFNSALLSSPVLSIYGGVTDYTEVYEANSVYKLTVEYQPANTISIDSLIFNINVGSSIGGIKSFVLGSLGSTDLITLPSDVENIIADISNNTALTNSRILSFLNDFRSFVDQYTSESGSTSSYLQVITVPSESINEGVAQITEAVENVQREIAEMKDIISSVVLPDDEAIGNAYNDSENATVDILSSDPEVSNMFKGILENSLISTILLVVIGCALIGYILFGKKA